LPARLDRRPESGFTEAVNITLFGYPLSGKTTLFNLLSGAHVELKAWEEGRREPHVRTLALPDERLDRLAALYPDRKKVAASVDLTDLVGVSFGEVKDSLLLGHLRKADGLVHVVRGFPADEIPHPKGRIDPAADITFMEEELVLADLVLTAGRLERLDKDLKKMKDPEGEKERDLLLRLRPLLESGRGLREAQLLPAEEKLVRSFAFLSLKPLLHAVNFGEQDAAHVLRPEGRLGLEPGGRPIMAFCGKIESELADVEDGEDRAQLMAGYGIPEPVAARFPRLALGAFDRLSFFTVGKDEVRAWTVKSGTPAVRAAGAVHTDMEKGFIRAEVVPLDDLLRHGSLPHAKEAGAIRLEGKDYVVRDGDVIYFRFAP